MRRRDFIRLASGVLVPAGMAGITGILRAQEAPIFVRRKVAAAAGGCVTEKDSYQGTSGGTLSLDAGSATNYYLGTPFSAASSYTLCSMRPRLSVALPGASAVAEIWTSSGGSGTAPGAKIGSSSSSVDLGTLGAEAYVTFGSMSISIVSGTRYFFVVKLVSGGGGFGGGALWHYNTAAGAGSQAFSMAFDSGGGWVDVGGGPDDDRLMVIGMA